MRHGRTKLNEAHRVRAWEDPPLDDMGRLDAQITANKLKIYRPKVVYSSDFMRDTGTAEIIALLCGNVPIEVDFGLRTANIGTLSGQKEADVVDITRRWYEDRYTPAPSGETFANFMKRFMNCLAPKIELARELKQFQPTVCVTHGKNLAVLDHYYNGFAPQDSHMPLPGGFGVIYSNPNGMDSFQFMTPVEPVLEDE